MATTSEPCLEEPPGSLVTAVEEFNSRQYFQCHSTLELLWMEEQDPIQDLYKGILQIAVALYHLHAGRLRSAIFLLERGSGYLQPYAPHCMGLDLEHLVVQVTYCLERLRHNRGGAMEPFDGSWLPQIRMST